MHKNHHISFNYFRFNEYFHNNLDKSKLAVYHKYYRKMYSKPSYNIYLKKNRYCKKLITSLTFLSLYLFLKYLNWVNPTVHRISFFFETTYISKVNN